MTLMLAKFKKKKRYCNLLPTTCCNFSSPCYTNQHLILYCNRTATPMQHVMETYISYCVFLFDWAIIIWNLTGLWRTRLKRLHDLWCQKVLKLKEKVWYFSFRHKIHILCKLIQNLIEWLYLVTHQSFSNFVLGIHVI